MELKQVLTDIARAIVDNPDAVNVTETVDGDDVELVLTVAEGDTVLVAQQMLVWSVPSIGRCPAYDIIALFRFRVIATISKLLKHLER